MKIFCVIGEESGDKHAAEVLSRLKKIVPDLQIVGTGGKNFREISDETYYRAEDMSVIGLWEVLKKRSYFVNIIEDLVSKIKTGKPDVLFLVDYPGMNIRIAEKVASERLKIIYYVSPQVWSWKKKRAFKLKKFTDLMITLFPFETRFLKEYAGMESYCFGHPALDIYERTSKKGILPENKKETGTINAVILPGSREGEIIKFLPVLCEAVKLAEKQLPELRFSLIKANQISLKVLKENGLEQLKNIEVIDDERYEAIYRADLAWCCSGTASLECAVLKTPPIIYYRVAPLTAWLGKHIFKIKVIGMPNVLLKKKVFPELLQNEFSAKNLIAETAKMLKSKKLTDKNNRVYERLHQSLGEKNSYDKCAKFIAEWIRSDFTAKKKDSC